MRISFNHPALAGNEFAYIREALDALHISGDGRFTKACQAWLQNQLHAPLALLTHSCTAALEMAAILCDIAAGDEVIMPSFTFVSTANAVVLRGGVPVFVDIRPDTLNLDENLIEAAITPRTKAIFVVHYAGVACEMDRICAIADRHGLLLVEDAAQALMASYHGRPLGGIGHLSTISFHETKNLISGEGGALVINDNRFIRRAEIVREKGTDRSQFFRGEVDKYTWQDIGSSYLPSDILAAFLLAQLEQADPLLRERLEIWDRYHAGLARLEIAGVLRRPVIPQGCAHNAHLYYVLLHDLSARTGLIAHLKERGIGALFHYVPLHDAPAGRRYTRTHGTLSVTENTAERLVRLPMWHGLGARQQDVIASIEEYFA